MKTADEWNKQLRNSGPPCGFEDEEAEVKAHNLKIIQQLQLEAIRAALEAAAVRVYGMKLNETNYNGEIAKFHADGIRAIDPLTVLTQQEEVK